MISLVLIQALAQTHDILKLGSFKCKDNDTDIFYDKNTNTCTSNCGKNGTFMINTQGICMEESECKNTVYALENLKLCVDCSQDKPQ